MAEQDMADIGRPLRRHKVFPIKHTPVPTPEVLPALPQPSTPSPTPTQPIPLPAPSKTPELEPAK